MPINGSKPKTPPKFDADDAPGGPLRFAYRTVLTAETIGTQRFDIEALADLDETIDALFEHLERAGQPQALERLAPYFGVIWPAGRALAERLAAEGARGLAGRRVLEVGCGLALPSLVAARFGARVTATDFHPEVPRFLARNQALNLAQAPGTSPAEFVALDWVRDHERLGQFDFVVGSDILYERHHAAAVAPILVGHLRPGGRLLIADPGRSYLQEFVDALGAQGMVVDTRIVPTSDRTGGAGGGTREIFLLSGVRPRF